MGQYAFLDAYDPIDRIFAPPEVEAKHHVPLFWLAMFDAGDLREDRLTGVRYANRENLFEIGPPYLRADAKTAIARLVKRVPALAALCTPTHQPLLKQFVSFAKRLKPAVIVRLDNLADGAGFVPKIRSALELVAALDDPQATAERYLVEPLTSVWSGPDWRDSEHANVLLAGWGWQVTAEERAQRARERKWQKAIGDRPSVELLKYEVTRAFQPDELLEHATLGAGIVTRVVDATKIEVLFREGPRTLVHGRAAKA